MPIYEYECPTHGRFEVSQRITADALSSCTTPDCGQPVRKLISHTSFALKGSGWYATDYKGSNVPAAPAPSAASPAKAESAAPAAQAEAPAASTPAPAAASATSNAA